MIVFLTKDLFFIPILQSAGAQAGTTVATLFSLDSEKAAAIAADEVTTCVVDLAGHDSAELPTLFDRLRGAFPAARLAAFGPHVQVEKLAAAKAAGCAQVLSRGQLNSQINRLIAEWASA